jgi:heme/copper-type cytochrome/quinol oxidase subunit 2
LESKLSGVRVSRTDRTRNFTVLVRSSVGVNVCSQDVIHSFSIPMLNVHVDATPRRNSIIKFSPYLVGTATATCQELCRHGHGGITLNLYF